MTKCLSSWIAKNEEILKMVSKLKVITKPGRIIFYVRTKCFENQRFTEK
jgi:hypothetical protein